MFYKIFYKRKRAHYIDILKDPLLVKKRLRAVSNRNGIHNSTSGNDKYCYTCNTGVVEDEIFFFHEACFQLRNTNLNFMYSYNITKKNINTLKK